MSTTCYFEEQVLRKRTYLAAELCQAVIATPIHREVQPDRIRHWGEVTLPDDPTTRILRVVILEDGEHPKRPRRPRLSQGRAMKLHYYPETDSLYIELRDAASIETREVADGVNADFDSVGNIVSLDVDRASSKIDLGLIEVIALPLALLKVA